MRRFLKELALYGCIGACALLLASCASKPPVIQDEPPSWQAAFERPIKFQLRVSDSLLVVATTRHLYGLDPVSGRKLWRKRNMSVSQNDLVSSGEDGYLLVNDAAGGAFDDRDTNILALDQRSGEIVWESRLLEGKVLQGALDASRDVLFFAKVLSAHGDDRGFLAGTLGSKGLGSGFEQKPFFGAIQISSGRLLWSREFDREVRMRPSQTRTLDEKADWTYTRAFDLDLYHPPVQADGLLCLTYAGLHCYDAETGNPAWGRRFKVIENELARSYASPVVDGNLIVTSGGNRVRAYDSASGKQRWRSEKFDFIPEILVASGAVYGQLGGQFFDLDREEWKWKGEFGVCALDKKSGKTLWAYAAAEDSVTNVLVYGEDVWLGDGEHLIALDRADGSVRLKTRHGFKEPPVYAALNEAGQVLLVGEGEVAAFDARSGDEAWHVRHAPLGPGAWQRFSRGLLHASGNILKFGSFLVASAGGVLPSLAVPLGAVDFKLVSSKKIVSQGMGRTGRRMAYQSGYSDEWEGNQSLSGNYQYFVTKPRRSKHVALAMVNLSTGVTERMIRMDSEVPNVVIDEANNRIFETFGRQLLAVPLRTGAADYFSLSTGKNQGSG